MDKPTIINLPKFLDVRGNLSFVEQGSHIPFEIKRTYWLYDVPGGGSRDGHAYIKNQEFIVALSGSFDIIVDDGINRQSFHMSRSYYGLYVPQGMWREMENFSTNSFAMILSSTLYDESDYLYDYNVFKTMKQHGEL